MRCFIVILVLSALPATAQVPDYRLIGTNIYDFTHAGSPSNPSPYVIRGKIGHIYPQSVELLIPDGVRYVPDRDALRDTMNTGDPNQMLQGLAAFKLSQQPLSAGAYYLLAPELRASLTAVPNYRSIYVLHLKPTLIALNLSPGCGLITLALPTKDAGFWDHGVAVTNPVCRRFFRLYPNHVATITNVVPLAPDPSDGSRLPVSLRTNSITPGSQKL